MPGKGFELGADLTAHAGQLDGVRDQLRQAVDAARQVSMPTDAYGILCQPFRMLLDPVENKGIDALNDAVKAVESVAEMIRASGKSYQSGDEGSAARLRAVD